jgi:hypothetical protein
MGDCGCSVPDLEFLQKTELTCPALEATKEFNGRVHGNVSCGGNPLEYVKITLTNDTNAEVATTFTDSKGDFSFSSSNSGSSVFIVANGERTTMSL